MRLSYTARALAQIDDALSYLAERSPRAASGLRARIETAVELIETHPQAAQATTRPNVRRMQLSPYPYALFYKTSEDAIIILRLRHSARRPLSG